MSNYPLSDNTVVKVAQAKLTDAFSYMKDVDCYEDVSFIFQIQLSMIYDCMMQFEKSHCNVAKFNIYVEWLCQMASTGISQIVSVLKSMYQFYVTSDTFYEFKAHFITLACWKNLSIFLELAYEAFDEYEHNTVMWNTKFKKVGSCIIFPCRGSFENSMLFEIALDEWLENEERLTSFRNHIMSSKIIGAVADVMSAWFSNFSFEKYKISPHHSNGATFECSRMNCNHHIVNKYANLILNYKSKLAIDYLDCLHGIDVEIYESIKRLSTENVRRLRKSKIRDGKEDKVHNALTKYVNNHTGSTVTMYSDDDVRSMSDKELSLALESCSRLIFVPKNATTVRTVSAESTAQVYLQHGVRESILRYILDNSFLASRIDIRDQSRNQKLCIEGSKSGEKSPATYDLSKASDSVSNYAVIRIFGQTPLSVILQALRNDKVYLPDGTIHSLECFAPMGAPLTFIIQTLIYGAFCQVACEIAAGREVDNIRPWFPHQWSAYGDDIIIPSNAGLLLSELLEANGWLINEDKSYSGKSSYRESCGIEAKAGYDITSLKVSRKLFSPSFVGGNDRKTSKYDLKLKWLVDKRPLIAASNMMDEYQFRHTRKWLLEILNSQSFDTIVFGMDNPDCVRSKNATNFHIKWKFSRYQTYCVKQMRLVQTSRYTRKEQNTRLYQLSKRIAWYERLCRQTHPDLSSKDEEVEIYDNDYNYLLEEEFLKIRKPKIGYYWIQAESEVIYFASLPYLNPTDFCTANLGCNQESLINPIII